MSSGNSYQVLAEADDRIASSPEKVAEDGNASAAAAASSAAEAPADPYRLTYIMFCYLGMAQLLPWNAFINANPYFATRVVGSIFSDNFKNYFSLGFMGSNVVFLALALRYQQKYSLALRMTAALVINGAVFLLATILTRLSEVEAHAYFYVTFVSVIFAGASTAFFQNSLFGLASEFPPIYTQAVMTGQGVAGFVVSVAQILAIVAGGAENGEIDSTACPGSSSSSSSYTSVSATTAAVLSFRSASSRAADFVSQSVLLFADAKGEAADSDDASGSSADSATSIAAFIYFLISFLIIVGGAVSYILLRKLPLYYHHHRLPKVLRQSQAQYRPLNNDDDDNDESDGQNNSNDGDDNKNGKVPTLASATVNAAAILDRPLPPISNLQQVFSIIRVPAVTVGLNFFITLALFPSITGSVQSLDRCNTATSKYYLGIFNSLHFLMFNLGDLIGRTATGYPSVVGFLIKRPVLVRVLTLSRIVFLPLFMLSNVVLFDSTGAPISSSIPAVFGNDVVFFVLMFLFAGSNGFFGSLLMMTGSEGVASQDKETAGSMMVFFLTFGLSLGSLSSFGLRAMLCDCNPFVG